MSTLTEIKIPDIGGSKEVDVIEIMVKPGDTVTIDMPLVTLESDKASMEIPASAEGVVDKILLSIGQKVSEGDVILTLKTDAAAQAVKSNVGDKNPESAAMKAPIETTTVSAPKANSTTVIIPVPDIGGAKGVDVIEIMVSVGDTIVKDSSIVTLEGDKATMEIPSPVAGLVEKVLIKVGDKVEQGVALLEVKTQSESATSAPKVAEVESPATEPVKSLAANTAERSVSVAAPSGNFAAGPAVRRIAREFGIPLAEVPGSGRKNRISLEDVKRFVQQRLAMPSRTSGSGMGLPEAPVIDFAQFGPIETKALNKIKRLTGQNLHRSWLHVPHVTQFDEADITELESFRKEIAAQAKPEDAKITMLAFVCKAVSRVLQEFPSFNASLDSSGENLILKQYVHIGIAVDTPNGLVVPVIRNVDKKNIGELAKDMQELSLKARNKSLTPQDMSGGCFTISSLGGIGGTAFTPIVNFPEVAILGLSRSEMKPKYQNGAFVPRLMLPLSLSYDHRVIDGAEAARFTQRLAGLLTDMRKMIL